MENEENLRITNDKSQSFTNSLNNDLINLNENQIRINMLTESEQDTNKIDQENNNLLNLEKSNFKLFNENQQDFPKIEIKEWEQYFFTEKVLVDIIDALEYEENILCLCTPAVADAFWRLKNKKIVCLDIDKRFEYLPGFVYYDILKPHKIEFKPSVIIVDPPFFKINLLDLYNTIDFLTEGDKNTKLIFAFVKREQKFLLYNFESYNLQLTKYKLEYRSVDPTKWDNYGIYTNYEFKKMKFVDKKSKEKTVNKNDKNLNNGKKKK